MQFEVAGGDGKHMRMHRRELMAEEELSDEASEMDTQQEASDMGDDQAENDDA